MHCKAKWIKDWLARHWDAIVIVALVLVVYTKSIGADFLGDDTFIIQGNSLVSSAPLFKIFTSEYWQGAGAPFSGGLYRPITILSYRINFALAGMDPAFFRIVNLVLHGLTAVIFMALLKRLGVEARTSLLAALLYSLHPVQAEVIGTIVGRAEILAAFFTFGGLRLGLSERKFAVPAAVLCFCLALLSKESAVAFIPLALAADYFVRSDFRNTFHEKRLYWASLLLVLSFWALGRHFFLPERTSRYIAFDNPMLEMDFITRLPAALGVQFSYIFKYIRLTDYHFGYQAGDIPLPEGFALKAVTVAGALFLLALVAIQIKNKRPSGFAGVVYIVGAASTSNVFFPVAMFFAERFQYLPSAGLALLGALAVERVSLALAKNDKRRRMLVFSILSVTATLVFSGAAASRSALFADTYALNTHVIKHSPGNRRSLRNLAMLEYKRGNVVKSESLLLSSIRLNPGLPEAYANIADFYFSAGRPAEALTWALKCPQEDRQPGYPGLLARGYAELGDYDKAVDFLRSDVYGSFDPNSIYAAAVVAEAEGDYDTALRGYEYAQKRKPSPESTVRITNILIAGAQYGEAIRVLQDTPDWWNYPEVNNMRGVAYAMTGNNEEAARWFSKAVESAPSDRAYKDNLDRARKALRGY